MFFSSSFSENLFRVDPVFVPENVGSCGHWLPVWCGVRGTLWRVQLLRGLGSHTPGHSLGWDFSGGRDQTSGVALKGMGPRTSMDDGWGKEGCSEKSGASEGRGGGKKYSCRQKGRRQRKGYLGRGNSTCSFTVSSWSGPTVLCNFLSKFMVTSSVIALASLRSSGCCSLNNQSSTS